MRIATTGDTVVLDGRLDVASAPDVRLALHAAIDAAADAVTVDLARVEMVDASGLGVIVGAHRRAIRSGRTLVLQHVPPRVMRLLWVSRLHRVLHFAPAVDDEAVVVLPGLATLAAS